MCIAFHGVEDSLGSLALPPGELDPVEQSIGLPRFPEARTSGHAQRPRATGLTAISEDVSVGHVIQSLNDDTCTGHMAQQGCKQIFRGWGVGSCGG